MELNIWGVVVQETTKAKEGEDRETILQMKASLSVDEAADLQRLMGRSCHIRLEDSLSYHAAREARAAGQLRMDLGAAVQTAPEPDPAMLCAACGHPRGHHPFGVCLLKDGDGQSACDCSEFVCPEPEPEDGQADEAAAGGPEGEG